MNVEILYFFIVIFLTEISANESKNDLLLDSETCGRQKTSGDNFTGTNANLGEFPWLALLKYTGNSNSDSGYRCIGSLINPKYVLTTAVCADPKEITLSEVRLGEHDLKSENDCKDKEEKECSGPVRDFGVEKKIVHEGFDRKVYHNDIALIRLNGTVEYSDYIKPICLPTSGAIVKMGDTVTASGWGRSVTGNLITIKKRVLSKVLTKEDCLEDYNKVNATISDNHLCSRSLMNNTHFTCAGDSGGPLMFLSNNQWYQEGITSFGIGCGYKFADVNTKVANYINWILENIEP